MQPTVQPEEPVDLAHPLGVAPGQVVVDRHHVHPASGEGVEVHGQDGHEGLALAGLHLGDLALVQDDAADQLYVEGAHPQSADCGFPCGGEGLGQKLCQGLLFGQALAEHLFEPGLQVRGLGSQVGVREGSQPRFPLARGVDHGLDGS